MSKTAIEMCRLNFNKEIIREALREFILELKGYINFGSWDLTLPTTLGIVTALKINAFSSYFYGASSGYLMDSKLLALPRDSWTTLRDVYAKDRTNLTGYDLIAYFINWTPSGSDETVRIYTTDADVGDYGTYILIHSVGQKAFVYLNTLDESLEKLQSALCSLNIQTWHLICGYDARLTPLVEHYWAARGQTCPHQEALVYHLPKSSIRKFPTDDYNECNKHCRNLEPIHARLVDEHCPYRSAESLVLIKGLIKNHFSVGCFEETGELLGWCLRSAHGSLSNLHVLAAHRRAGVGSLMIRFIAQILEARDSEVLATVLPDNEKSRKMFKKLGFEVINTVYWSAVPEINE